MQILKESLSSITYEQQANAARYNNREFLYRTLGECIKREDFPHLFLDQPAIREENSDMFFEDPLGIDDIELMDLERLDGEEEVKSQPSIMDMLRRKFVPSVLQRSSGSLSEIPNYEIRSDAQAQVFKAPNRYT